MLAGCIGFDVIPLIGIAFLFALFMATRAGSALLALACRNALYRIRQTISSERM